MGTKATIAIEHKDGSVEKVRLHYDGYPFEKGMGAGDKLLKHYNDRSKIESLIAMGEVYVLRRYIGDTRINHRVNPNDFLRQHDISTFINRDLRNKKYDTYINNAYYPEDAEPNSKYSNIKEYLKGRMEGYNYLYTKTDEWALYIPDSPGLIPLISFMEEEEREGFIKGYRAAITDMNNMEVKSSASWGDFGLEILTKQKVVDYLKTKLNKIKNPEVLK